MKNLFLLSVLLMAGAAHAQSVTEAFKKGEVAQLIWNKDIQEAAQTGNAFVLIHVEKADANSKTTVDNFAKAAKAYAGKYLVAYADYSVIKANKSSLNVSDLNNSKSNVELAVFIQSTPAVNYEVDEVVTEAKAKEYLGRIFTQIDQAVAAAKAEASAPKAQSSHESEDSKEVLEIKSDAELKKLLANSKKVPVIIDFSGKNADGRTWCGPCRSFHPAFVAAAKAYKDKAIFVQVNIHSDWSTSEPAMGITLFGDHQLNGVPSVIVFNKGTEKGSKIELRSFDADTFVKQVSGATGIKK